MVLALIVLVVLITGLIWLEYRVWRGVLLGKWERKRSVCARRRP